MILKWQNTHSQIRYQREWERKRKMCRNQRRPFWSGPASGGEKWWEWDSHYTRLFIEPKRVGMWCVYKAVEGQWDEKMRAWGRTSRKQHSTFSMPLKLKWIDYDKSLWNVFCIPQASHLMIYFLNVAALKCVFDLTNLCLPVLNSQSGQRLVV